jgi:hypothetical protein
MLVVVGTRMARSTTKRHYAQGPFSRCFIWIFTTYYQGGTRK